MSKNVPIHPKIKLMISMCTVLVINKLITQYYVKMTVLLKFYKMIKNFTLIQHYHQLIATLPTNKSPANRNNTNTYINS